MDRTQIFTRTQIALALVLPVALVAGRTLYTGRVAYFFLLWNLFLAWLPLLFAFLALHARRRAVVFAPLFAIAWLLFLPNAPYLVTDIIHMPRNGGISGPYDAVLLFVFAMSGAFLGVASLRWMEEAVMEEWGTTWGRLFALAVIGLTGFGVYIGRYLRWNSWDVVTNPASLLRDIYPFVVHPVQNWQVWVLSLLFAAAFAFAYWLLRETPLLAGPASAAHAASRSRGRRKDPAGWYRLE